MVSSRTPLFCSGHLLSGGRGKTRAVDAGGKAPAQTTAVRQTSQRSKVVAPGSGGLRVGRRVRRLKGLLRQAGQGSPLDSLSSADCCGSRTRLRV